MQQQFRLACKRVNCIETSRLRQFHTVRMAAAAGTEATAEVSVQLPTTYKRLVAGRTGQSFRDVAVAKTVDLEQPGPGEVRDDSMGQRFAQLKEALPVIFCQGLGVIFRVNCSSFVPVFAPVQQQAANPGFLLISSSSSFLVDSNLGAGKSRAVDAHGLQCDIYQPPSDALNEQWSVRVQQKQSGSLETCIVKLLSTPPSASHVHIQTVASHMFGISCCNTAHARYAPLCSCPHHKPLHGCTPATCLPPVERAYRIRWQAAPAHSPGFCLHPMSWFCLASPFLSEFATPLNLHLA